DGNMHTLGVRMLELYLIQSGVTVQAIHPGIPFYELTQVVFELKPEIVGLSVAMPEQMEGLREWAQLAVELESPPKVFAGGHFIKEGHGPEPAVNVFFASHPDVILSAL